MLNELSASQDSRVASFILNRLVHLMDWIDLYACFQCSGRASNNIKTSQRTAVSRAGPLCIHLRVTFSVWFFVKPIHPTRLDSCAPASISITPHSFQNSFPLRNLLSGMHRRILYSVQVPGDKSHFLELSPVVQVQKCILWLGHY